MCCCQCRPARCESAWACTRSWRARGPGSARRSPVSGAGAAPQTLRVCRSVGEAGTGPGCTAGPSLPGGWWPLGYPANRRTTKFGQRRGALFGARRARQREDTSCKRSESEKQQHRVTSLLTLEEPLISANEHSLRRRARRRGNAGGRGRGSSTALVAKHKRKDQC